MLLKGALKAMLIAIHKFAAAVAQNSLGGFTAFTLPSAQNQDITTLMQRDVPPAPTTALRFLFYNELIPE